jgi:mono/diheme cytochrome c family protein
MPVNSGVGALLNRGSSLLIGAGGAVLTRTAAAAPANPTPSPSTSPSPTPSSPPVAEQERYFDPHVRLVLQGACVACHSVGLSDAFNAYPLARLPDDDVSFSETVARVDVSNPAASLLIQKATGQVAHGGGAVVDTNSVSYEYLVNWARQGARRSATVNPFKTYLADVRPLIIKNNCIGCHTGRAYQVTADEQTNYNEVLQFTDLNTPTNSEFLLRNDGGLNHAGGAPWPAGNADRDTIIQWIVDGARYN